MIFQDHELTAEQEVPVKHMITGEDSTIQAPAGSGKTFVLQAGAQEIKNKKGLYVAYNRAIADEAGTKFQKKVECRTGHSVAFRAVGWKYKDRLRGSIPGKMLANLADIGDTGNFPTKASKAYAILDCITKFCHSDDDALSEKHVVLKSSDEEISKEIKNNLAHYARNIFDAMQNENGSLPITHDVYLKIWALEKPTIYKDFIFLDEAQDSNPVILGVISRQLHAQRVYVGDKFQQIYSWRGAINAMENIKTKNYSYITQSFRFGEEVANIANQILQSYSHPSERPPSIKGFKEKDSRVSYTRVDNPDAILCRTNAGVISQLFVCLEQDKDVYVQGGTSQMISLLKGMDDLKNGKRSIVPDLALFTSWDEVLEYAESSSGKDVKGLLRMIDLYGTNQLIAALYDTAKNKFEADVTITTAHKSKGLEWPKVRLHDDFFYPEEGKFLPSGERNILYVAATRALDVLDISNCIACHPSTLKMANEAYYQPA